MALEGIGTLEAARSAAADALPHILFLGSRNCLPLHVVGQIHSTAR
jgi:hypothetical protein